MTTALIVTLLLTILITVLCQNPSPCPEVLAYEPKREEDRWYGLLSLRTSEDLTGVFLHVVLDRPADLLGNWFGEASSVNNTEYIIRNTKYRLEAGPPITVRFFVKYNPGKTTPSVKTILLNGRSICSATGSKETISPTQPMLHISRPVKPTELPSHSVSNNNNRPSGSNGSGSNTRPSSSSSSGGSSRPSSSSSGRPSSSGSRPSSSGGSNNRIPDSHNSATTYRPTSRPSSSSSNFRPDSSELILSNNERETDFNNQRPSTDLYGNSPGFHQRPNPESTNGLSSETDFDEDDDSDFFPGDFSNLRPSNRPSSNRPQVTHSQRSTCGTTAMRPNALVSNGQNTTPGQWPWHAALYHSKGIQLMYVCGGTLISKQHVVTAAHCVTRPQSNKAVNKQYLLVYFGKYNLLTFGPEVQDRDLDEIYVHPQYNHTVYFNDIAILKLTRPVEITNFVRPCCLWEDDDNTDLTQIVEKQGTVVGWGFDENRKLSSQLMQAQMPVVSTVKCIYSNREFFSQFTFEKNFCAGFRNGTSVCNGDSGGGMVFPKKGTSGHNTVWQLRGLVSVGVALQGQGICDTSQYIVFTDVAKYTSWIKQIINQDSSRRSFN